MRITHKGPEGLTNFYCIKCECVTGAMPRATVWCHNGHRMGTKRELDEAEERRLKRKAKKMEKDNG